MAVIGEQFLTTLVAIAAVASAFRRKIRRPRGISVYLERQIEVRNFRLKAEATDNPKALGLGEPVKPLED